MRLEDKLAAYLEYCEYRKELDKKAAYRLHQLPVHPLLPDSGLLLQSSLHL